MNCLHSFHTRAPHVSEFQAHFDFRIIFASLPKHCPSNTRAITHTRRVGSAPAPLGRSSATHLSLALVALQGQGGSNVGETPALPCQLTCSIPAGPRCFCSDLLRREVPACRWLPRALSRSPRADSVAQLHVTPACSIFGVPATHCAGFRMGRRRRRQWRQWRGCDAGVGNQPDWQGKLRQDSPLPPAVRTASWWRRHVVMFAVKQALCTRALLQLLSSVCSDYNANGEC